MAEQIISPGVFTRENDLSFLPAGVASIGAAVIGPTVKGPAFVPSVVRSFAEYEQRFGPLSSDTYVPQTVREYLKNAGSVTVVRVLAGAGYSYTAGGADGKTSGLAFVAGNANASSASPATGSFTMIQHGQFKEEEEVQITSNGVIYRFIAGDNTDGLPNSGSVANGPWYFASASDVGASATNLVAAINFANSGSAMNIFAHSASAGDTGIQLTASIQGTATPLGGTLANSVTVSTGSGNQTFKLVETLEGGTGASGTGGVLLGLLLPSKDSEVGGGGLQQSLATVYEGQTIHLKHQFNLHLSGSNNKGSVLNEDIYSGSTLDPSSANYVFDRIGYNPDNSKVSSTAYTGVPGYTYLNFKTLTTQIYATGSDFPGYGVGSQLATTGVYPYGSAMGSGSVLEVVTQSADINFTAGLGTEKYNFASTPYIQGQIALGRKDLFRICTLDHGKQCNTDFKISIANFKQAGDIDGVAQYAQFSVILRKADDKDKNPVIIEQFNNCTLDPDSPRYIARVIGDRYPQYNDSLGKVEMLGNYPNNSKHVRVQVTEAVAGKSLSPSQSPRGFAAVSNPINPSSFSTVSFVIPSASYEGFQTTENSMTSPISYSSKGYLGFKFADKEADNLNFLKPLPDGTDANDSGPFSVEDYSGHPSSSLWTGALTAAIDVTGVDGPTSGQLKFTVPFQGGDDGINPSTIIKTGLQIEGSNLFGFDLSNASASGSVAYKKALDIVANQDEYDINMLVLPGVIKEFHSSVTSNAIDMCESRGDVFYVMDLANQDATVNQAVNTAAGLDTNFAAVYYPWVKVLDDSIGKPILVPPSVIVPGAIAASDRIGAEWFAPAGLNRGILGNVLEARIRLNQAERDSLYDAKINPIATFPQTGVCIWGQKTLQERSTALDRINVRRLLINLKKFIASSSKYLVFEQNTLQTRTRFLNIVSPYLENIQQNQGLFAFRVVMDESNNTPEVVDRNQLVGAVYLQPTKTAEFIILDFNVLPTGATFPA